MAFEGAFAGRDYAACINSVISLANRFLSASKKYNLRFVMIPDTPRLTKVVTLVREGNLQQVKDLEPYLLSLDRELDILVKKFQLVQRSHQVDPDLKNFLGDFSRDSEDAFKKLDAFVSDSLRLVDSVITVYAQIERAKRPIQTWVATILSPGTSSSKTMVEKAKQAQKIIAEVDTVTKDIRNMSQQARAELDTIKGVATRNLIRRNPAASGFAKAGVDAANKFYSS